MKLTPTSHFEHNALSKMQFFFCFTKSFCMLLLAVDSWQRFIYLAKAWPPEWWLPRNPCEWSGMPGKGWDVGLGEYGDAVRWLWVMWSFLWGSTWTQERETLPWHLGLAETWTEFTANRCCWRLALEGPEVGSLWDPWLLEGSQRHSCLTLRSGLSCRGQLHCAAPARSSSAFPPSLLPHRFLLCTPLPLASTFSEFPLINQTKPKQTKTKQK